MNNSIMKKRVIELLHSNSKPGEPEEKLAFAVIRQAIEDIGVRGLEEEETWENSDVNSWCQVIGLDYEYVLRVLRECSIIN